MPNSDYKDIKIFAGHRKNGATICNIYSFLWEKNEGETCKNEHDARIRIVKKALTPFSI